MPFVGDAFAQFDDTGAVVGLQNNDRGSTVTPLSPALLIGQFRLKKQPQPIESMAIHATLAVGTIGGTTFQNAYAMEAPFYQVRVGIINATAAPMTINALGIGVGDVLTDNHPTTAGIPSGLTQGTYGGGISITGTPMVCPAASSGPVPTITWTDWLSPAAVNVAMAANPGLYPLFVQASVSEAAGFMLASNANFVNNPNNAAGGRFKRGGSAANGIGSRVNGSYSGSQFVQCLPMIVQTRSTRRTIQTAVLSDSIDAGNVLADGADTNCWLIKSCNQANAEQDGVRFSAMNWAHGGQTSTAYFNRLASLLAAAPPDILFYAPYSNNDGVGSQNKVNTCIRQALQVLAACEAAKVAVVLPTHIPINGASLSDDNYRKSTNEVIRGVASSMNIPLLDFDAAMSDGGSPASIRAGLNADTQHPNPAGRDVQVATAMPYLRSLYLV